MKPEDEKQSIVKDEEPTLPEALSGATDSPSRLKRFRRGFFEFFKIVVFAGITILVVRHYLFKPFSVKGSSMEPTFLEREYLIVDELTYRLREPKRGEVIVFRAPHDDKDYYLKRIIGLPGERVKVENQKVIVYNEEHPLGFVLDEPYIADLTFGNISVDLEEGEYFVLGDNRNASYDSRRFGPIEQNTIIGRAVFRGWPFHRMSTFDLPEYGL